MKATFNTSVIVVKLNNAMISQILAVYLCTQIHSNRSLKISGAATTYFIFFFIALGLLTYGFSSLLDKNVQGVYRNNMGEIVYKGEIEQDKVTEVIDLYQAGDTLVIRSSGGDLHAGMLLGDFINKHEMTVEVLDFCISSCANYVFLSAANKVLNTNSLVIFHGGPKQKNFRSLMQQAYGESVAPGTIFGREGYEAIISTKEVERGLTMRNRRAQCSKNEVVNRAGKCEEFGPEQRLQYIIYLENELYSRVSPAMDKNIPYYGHQGEYEETYNRYKYFGFYYSLDSLAQLGVENISVKNGGWEPASNPLFPQIYEVSGPFKML